MTAFPQLGSGFRTNRQTIVDPPASYEAIEWMKKMDYDTFIAMITKHHKNWNRLSRFTQCCIAKNFEKNPERLFQQYAEEFPTNQSEQK